MGTEDGSPLHKKVLTLPFDPKPPPCMKGRRVRVHKPAAWRRGGRAPLTVIPTAKRVGCSTSTSGASTPNCSGRSTVTPIEYLTSRIEAVNGTHSLSPTDTRHVEDIQRGYPTILRTMIRLAFRMGGVAARVGYYERLIDATNTLIRRLKAEGGGDPTYCKDVVREGRLYVIACRLNQLKWMEYRQQLKDARRARVSALKDLNDFTKRAAELPPPLSPCSLSSSVSRATVPMSPPSPPSPPQPPSPSPPPPAPPASHPPQPAPRPQPPFTPSHVPRGKAVERFYAHGLPALSAAGGLAIRSLSGPVTDTPQVAVHLILPPRTSPRKTNNIHLHAKGHSRPCVAGAGFALRKP
eukprot:Sspe_Gene.86855::Locus_57646_Transcript_1_1_Confidence_1.000_Length_3051::g.86855::m.86855